MKITGKKPWYMEYLLIIVGTALMATAITSCFDAAGLVTGGFRALRSWSKQEQRAYTEMEFLSG